MSSNNLMYIDRVRDHSYTFNDLMLKNGGGTHKMPDGSIMLNSDMPMKHGGSMPSKISIKPMPSPSYSLMLSPLAMKTGGIVDSGLYKTIQSIGYGNKTYLSSI